MTNAAFDLNAFLNTISLDAAIVLRALIASASAAGYDFGFMDEANAESGFGRHKFAGHIANLGRVIEWSEDLSNDRHVECNEIQFGLIEEVNSDAAYEIVDAFIAAQDETAAEAPVEAPVEVAEVETVEVDEAAAKAAAKAALKEARKAYVCTSVKDIAPEGETATAICPCCGTTAEGVEAIESTFGVRRMKAWNDEAATYALTIRVQSYCKPCRSSKAAKARAEKAARTAGSWESQGDDDGMVDLDADRAFFAA